MRYLQEWLNELEAKEVKTDTDTYNIERIKEDLGNQG